MPLANRSVQPIITTSYTDDSNVTGSYRMGGAESNFRQTPYPVYETEHPDRARGPKGHKT